MIRRRRNDSVEDFWDREDNPATTPGDRLFYLMAELKGVKGRLDTLHDELGGMEAVLGSRAVNHLDQALEVMERLLNRIE